MKIHRRSSAIVPGQSDAGDTTEAGGADGRITARRISQGEKQPIGRLRSRHRAGQQDAGQRNQSGQRRPTAGLQRPRICKK